LTFLRDEDAAMGKGKGAGGFKGKDVKGVPAPPIAHGKRPMPPSVPRIMPRTKASSKGR
jgi:hypothetical protein